MKKLGAAALALTLAGAMTLPALAAEENPILISAQIYPTAITLNGEALDTGSLPAVDGSLLPMRLLAESDHGSAYWDQEGNQGWFTFGQDRIIVNFADNSVTLNDQPLEVAGGLSKGERRGQVEAALADVGLEGCLDKMPDELSGGMRQRAAFARTMLTGSDLLLLDEPFSALDFLTRVSMQEWLLDQWLRHKKTILFITHDVEEAVFLSSSVLVVESTPIRALTEIPVPAAFPRDRACLAEPGMVELKERLIALLRKQVTV